MPEIVIDVAGEPGGTPGVPDGFGYDKIDGSPPLVTMYLDDEEGVTDWSWEVWSTPPGVAVVVSGSESNIATWSPEAYIPGTYLVKCVVNGAVIVKMAVWWGTKNLNRRLPAQGETTEFGEKSGWDPAIREFLLAIDEGSGGGRKRAVLDYVDCTAAPPTSNPGDRYILDDSGSVHGDWDGAPQLAIVETIDGATWTVQPHGEGDICLVDAKNYDMQYVDDGTPMWEPKPAGAQISDETESTGIVAGSGFWEQQIQTGLEFTSFLGQYVYLNMTSGITTDTEIRIYHGDPSSGGEIIYQATNINLSIAAHKDANVWWAELAVSGEYWVRIYNHGGADAEYDVRVRVKTDVF